MTVAEASGYGNLPRFTARESEVLRLLDRGLPDTHIAKSLAMSPEAVLNHTRNIAEKLRLRLELVGS